MKWTSLLMNAFQSTLPRRERHCFVFNDSVDGVFQSTLPRRERHPTSQLITDMITVSIHAPTKGATKATRTALRAQMFQSTLPRRERPRCAHACRPTSHVSIHAPTKGATLIFRHHLHRHVMFQSTLPRRERR